MKPGKQVVVFVAGGSPFFNPYADLAIIGQRARSFFSNDRCEDPEWHSAIAVFVALCLGTVQSLAVSGHVGPRLAKLGCSKVILHPYLAGPLCSGCTMGILDSDWPTLHFEQPSEAHGFVAVFNPKGLGPFGLQDQLVAPPKHWICASLICGYVGLCWVDGAGGGCPDFHAAPRTPILRVFAAVEGGGRGAGDGKNTGPCLKPVKANPCFTLVDPDPPALHGM